jgi:hypothetical protein
MDLWGLDVGVGSRWRTAIINHTKLVIWLIDPYGNKVVANAAVDAKHIVGAIIEQVSWVMAEAEARAQATSARDWELRPVSHYADGPVYVGKKLKTSAATVPLASRWE